MAHRRARLRHDGPILHRKAVLHARITPSPIFLCPPHLAMAGQDRWLDAGSAHPWIAAQQRKALWMLQTPMLISKQLPGWDDAHLSGQGYGGRPSDVDGRCRAAHPGTLIGTYCSVTLLPDLRTGFVVLINGQGEHTVMTRAPINPDADFSYGHQDLYFQRTGACPAL